MTSAIASTSSGSQPNTSLYVRNLNTKTKKPELRRQLYSLFSTYGKVIDIVATRTDGMRGRAFVVFRDLSSATAARRALDGFEFYDRSIAIDYAHSQSKATIILEKGPEALFDPSLFASGSSSTGPSASSKNKVTVSSAQADQRGREKKRAREEARQRGEIVEGEEEEEEESDDEEEEEDVGEPKSKARKIEGADGGQKQEVEEEEEEEEEETAMDMADSDSDDDDAPGPAPPP
ncbi:RNA-binding domain-containing protein [Microstroma glucosiphilum]|uniref:RNA-binding domain-containing protein n=1 Tax=Pseudomicrostroma glucosiphilum TaxID=1684307 RepID=A0A316U2D3_9BASI|nr:RNA-binding domain-containing protein [Pseudomicrostroma glucosiphilum]PWN19506.1 RNA-binding domain-containing protein [Pseudomicrostroma glucosiphilum]